MKSHQEERNPLRWEVKSREEWDGHYFGMTEKMELKMSEHLQEEPQSTINTSGA